MEEVIQEALSRGVELHAAGEYDLAGQLYESVIKLQPEHADANHNMGVLKFTTGHDLEALPFLQTALQADTTIAQFWLSYIKALIRLEKLEDAARILDLAKESGFESKEFVELNQLINPPTESAPVAETVAEASNPPQETLNYLINLYNQGKLKEVVEQAKETIRHYPHAFMAWNILGTIFAQNGELDKAISAFKKVISLNANFAPAYNNLGNILKHKCNFAGAIKAYKKAISLNGNFTEAFSNLSTVFEKTGNFDEALNAVSNAITLSPHNAQAQNNKGVILQAMQRYDEAKLAYEKAIQIDQVFADAIYNIGELYLEEGNWQEASVRYKRVLEIQPDSAAALYGLGKCYMKLGKKDLASINFEKSKVLDTENVLGNDLQLALMNKEHVPNKTPENYLKDFYRKKSKTWGKEKGINYQGHAIIEDALKTVNFTKPLNILDLGCGTGSLGKFLKPFSNSLVGVDISPDMLSKANYDSSYDCLHLNEIESFLSKNLDTYDLIVAAAVLIHFLSLEDIFSLVNKNLNDNGSFVFSIFENKIADKSINDFLMYSHNNNYVEMVSANTGFRIIYSKKAVHEYHGKEKNPVFAWTYVLTKDHKKIST